MKRSLLFITMVTFCTCFFGQEQSMKTLPSEFLTVDTLKDVKGAIKKALDTLAVTDTSNNTNISSLEDQSLPLYADTGYVVDFAPEYDSEIIRKRIEETYSDVPLRYNNRINSFIDYFTIRNRDYTRKMIQRSEVYFPILEEVLAKNGMPESIKYLAIVESGLDPKIRSWAGAMGLWQFMPATGKAYGLDYDYYIDERLDPYKATDAACKYLKVLYGMFGNWEMALGAYNCGPGNMRKAIRKSGNKKTFEEVYNYLPKETRSYVPQFMAVNYVMRFTDEHNLYVEDWEKSYMAPSDTMVFNQYLDLDRFSQLTGVCLDQIIQLNPEIKRNTITKQWVDYEMVLPKEVFALDKDSLSSILLLASNKGEEQLNYKYKNPNASDLAGTTKISYKVKRGDNLGKIAQKHKVSVRNIKSWNRMRNSTIYPGQRLSIYTKGIHKNGPTLKKGSEKIKPVDKIVVKEGDKIIHIVKRGEVLGSIADKYDVGIYQLREWNNISGNLIKVGQKLEVYNKAKKSNKQVANAVDDLRATKIYTVKKGDALYTIATNYKMTVKELKELNSLKNNNLSVGDKLKVYDTNVPETANKSFGSKEYVVKSGDSLWSISKKLNLSVNQIKEWNNLTSNSLKPGQVLKIG